MLLIVISSLKLKLQVPIDHTILSMITQNLLDYEVYLRGFEVVSLRSNVCESLFLNIFDYFFSDFNGLEEEYVLNLLSFYVCDQRLYYQFKILMIIDIVFIFYIINLKAKIYHHHYIYAYIVIVKVICFQVLYYIKYLLLHLLDLNQFYLLLLLLY